MVSCVFDQLTTNLDGLYAAANKRGPITRQLSFLGVDFSSGNKFTLSNLGLTNEKSRENFDYILVIYVDIWMNYCSFIWCCFLSIVICIVKCIYVIYIYVTRSVSGITLIRYVQSQNIWKPNNLRSLWARKPKGLTRIAKFG